MVLRASTINPESLDEIVFTAANAKSRQYHVNKMIAKTGDRTIKWFQLKHGVGIPEYVPLLYRHYGIVKNNVIVGHIFVSSTDSHLYVAYNYAVRRTILKVFTRQPLKLQDHFKLRLADPCLFDDFSKLFDKYDSIASGLVECSCASLASPSFLHMFNNR